MVNTEWLRVDEVITIRPDGAIDDEDFLKVGAIIDPVIARKGRLEVLLVDTRSFAGWDDAHALLAHMRFVHAHQTKVARIAVVGDHWWLRAAPSIEPFYGTPIKVFAGAEKNSAKGFLLESAP